MHELSIALELADAVMAEAEARGHTAITTVHLRLGPLSGVDKDALQFAFPLACDGTPLHGARLVIEDVPLRVSCEACGAETQPPSLHELACSKCGAAATRIVRGRELELSAFEVAEEVSP